MYDKMLYHCEHEINNNKRSNSVKQGEILSLLLFDAHLYDISLLLKEHGVRSHIDACWR